MRNLILWMIGCLLVFSTYGTISYVYADDKEKKEKKWNDEHSGKYERGYGEKEYGEVDDEDFEENEEYERHEYEKEEWKSEEKVIKKEYWYKWSRSPDTAAEYEPLPILHREKVRIVTNSKKPLEVIVIPMKGQLFVPLEETATYMGASVTSYPNSQIAEIELNEHYLVVRNGTRVVYEEMKKTPAPLPLFSEYGNLYIPISVLTNGLGFQVTWNGEQIEIYR